MREENNIEKTMGEKFTGFQMAVPGEVWGRIEAILNEKKKKPLLFWWMFGGTAVLAGFTMLFIQAYFGVNNESIVANRNVEKMIKTKKPKENETSNIITSGTEELPQKIENADKSKKRKDSGVSYSENNDKSARSTNNSKDLKSARQQKFAQIANNSTDLKSARQQKPATTTSEFIDLNTARKLAVENANILVEKSSEKSSEKTNQPVTINDKTLAESTANKKEIKELDKEGDVYVDTEKNMVFDLGFRKPIFLASSFDLKLKTTNLKGIQLKPAVKNTFWSISATVSVSDNFRKLSVPNEPSLRTHRNQNEKQFVSLSYQIQAEYTFTNNMFSLGYGFTKKGELYDFKSNLISHSSKNFYSYDQLQFGFARRIAMRKRFVIVPGLRANMNFLKNAHASWVDPITLIPVTHSSGAASPYRKQVVSGEIFVELVTSYKHVEYFLSPKFNMMLQSVYKNGVPIKQYPFSAELGFGIRYKL